MSLAANNVHFSYKGQLVLAGFTHPFEQGRITAVLGKSGTGKSTLLRLLNGMLRPQSGEILWSGQPIVYRRAHQLRRKIGYVIQDAGLFPHMTMGRNIGLTGRASGADPKFIDDRISILLEKVRLPASYRAKFPHELSGGEQQRAGLCRALLLNPSVMLMDEPFASLDHETRLAISQYLLEIQQQEPRTIVLVTHDLDEAIRLADAFILIEDGKVKAEGGKRELSALKLKNSVA